MPPTPPPTLNEMIRMVASLGGYLNRKSDPEPGVKTMWVGFRDMQEHIRAKEAFEAAYGKPTCGNDMGGTWPLFLISGFPEPLFL